MSRPFIIYALPRSRTCWLSKFLTYGDWYCAHDLPVHLHTLEAVADFLRIPNRGTAETGLIEGYKKMRRLLPYAKRVVILRSPVQVLLSLKQAGFPSDSNVIHRQYAALQEVAALPGTKVYAYSELHEEWACREIFEFCVEQPFDPVWWQALRRANIQVRPAARLGDIVRNHAGVERVLAEMRACQLTTA